MSRWRKSLKGTAASFDAIGTGEDSLARASAVHLGRVKEMETKFARQMTCQQRHDRSGRRAVTDC